MVDGIVAALIGVLGPVLLAGIGLAWRRWRRRQHRRREVERRVLKLERNMRVLARSCLNLAQRTRRLEDRRGPRDLP